MSQGGFLGFETHPFWIGKLLQVLAALLGEGVLVTHGERFPTEHTESYVAPVTSQMVPALQVLVQVDLVEQNFVTIYAKSLASRQKVRHYHFIIHRRRINKVSLQLFVF